MSIIFLTNCQKCDMDNQDINKIEIVPLSNTEYLCEMAYKYERNTSSLKEIQEIIHNHYILGYEVTVNGLLCGVAYATKFDGFYLLDGHNRGVSIFTASKMGKMVCHDLFDSYTDIVYSVHDSDEKHLDLLLKRIGFLKLGIFGDRTAFVLERSWVK